MVTEKEILFMERLLSEGADELTGEWWITEDGETTYESGDVGEYTHSLAAMEHMLGFQVDEAGIPIMPLEPLNRDAIRYLKQKEISEEIISYLTKGNDPCQYAMQNLGWVYVKNNTFKTYRLDENASKRISKFLNDRLGDDSGNVMVEEISSGQSWLIPAWMIMNGSGLEEIKGYASEQKVSRDDIINLVSTISEDLVPLVLTLMEEAEKGDTEKEYEKRYKLKELPKDIHSPSRIVQGLLFDKPGFNLRVRRELKDKEVIYTMTCKFFENNDEAEVEITRQMFDKLWPETILGKRMRKTRYKYDEKWIIDDIYEPNREVVAEIELKNEDGDVDIPDAFELITSS